MLKPSTKHLVHSATIVKVISLVLLSLFLLRLASLGMYPLFDTTEARYGEIARIMLETRNWVTPQFDYNVPFWGKPPFHTWLSAASFSLFGVSEFFARLPHLLVGMLTALVVFRFVALLVDTQKAVVSVFVLASTLGFILAIGMVMTDSSLLLAYTLAMTSFWLNYQGYRSKLHGHLFFTALALGMLVKGPVAVALVVIALIMWSVWEKQFVKAFCSLPWKTGFPLFWLLVVPWYAWAEIRTPGFLEYFIIGEHIQRFLVSGWAGDLYGSAHDRPRGSIWIYWILCAFPWSFFVIKSLLSKMTKSSFSSEHESQIKPYLVAWIFAPLVLFTFAGNILPIYVMPGFGAMAVFVTITNQLSKRLVLAGCLTLCILSITTVLLISGKVTLPTQQKLLVANATSIQEGELYYWYKRPFSAQFYSQGKAKLLKNIELLESKLDEQAPFFLVINTAQLNGVANILKNNCKVVEVVNKHILYQCN
ncbi:glycosyltransferase family 39 protein [Pseudoalteromonas sp. Of7M-16]|uniref:ArnT family glycosyltransferase n=1 Tax=Pseudoalteromonas sp. Of7M-16 TaxID=2917756 RepID=UPI001EF47AD9|nr:glycosyltransferase family 39 protein [Pseudoalteromonas sp. Of7M-16]MCG7550472.1 glycosyltransferase family 39 protein [Pseudoalteromonas sp. Of7M-16]